jgi:hypothetical protein
MAELAGARHCLNCRSAIETYNPPPLGFARGRLGDRSEDHAGGDEGEKCGRQVGGLGDAADHGRAGEGAEVADGGDGGDRDGWWRVSAAWSGTKQAGTGARPDPHLVKADVLYEIPGMVR